MSGPSYLVAGGELIRWKRRGALGDAYSLFENVTQPGYPGPPPHRHLGQDETWFVMDGSFAFDVDGATIAAGPGDCVHAPRGVVHTFRNTGTDVGRLLVVVGPAGDFEAFVEETGEPTTANLPPALDGPPSAAVIERVLAGARRHHIDIPPPDATH
ncbi:MAG TPA: cupin domain-containing protein [Thermomicrobiales bacterium]|nr:cupin domain-containing protein [Thermomicrobiales bacterium]